MPEVDLSKLTAAAKDELILSLLPLVGQLEAALARIAELEKRLAAFERPPKTPRQPARPWGGVAGVPGASAARRALRRRVRRYRLQRRVQASTAARDCHRATA